MEYPWYDVVNDQSLEQGDILENFVILEPSTEFGNVEKIYNLIVMTHSCDVDKVPHIISCPIWTRQEIESIEPPFFKSGKLGDLVKYRVIGFYLIDKCEIQGFERPCRIVQFQRVLEVEKKIVMEHIRKQHRHLRLLPPYREHLSQHFARFFMRVDLPKPLKPESLEW